MEKYRKALVEELASRGNRDAILELVRYYLDNPDDENFDAEILKKYLLELAQKGDKKAMLILGGQYYVGRYFPQSYKEAVKWYTKAADELDSYGLCYLGYCYYYGRDIDVDYEKAYNCFTQSAYLENSNAMYKLGDMFFNGYYVKEDKETAFYWYDQALYDAHDNDYERASIEYRLGKCYLHGYGVEPDLFLALKKLQSAERHFFNTIEDDRFARLTLKWVKKELDIVRDRLYGKYEIE